MCWLNTVKDVGSILIPIATFLLSVIIHRRNVVNAKKEFYERGNSSEQKQYRKKLYDWYKANEGKEKSESEIEKELLALDKDGDLGQIISFYDEWSSYRNYLPINVFKGATGATAVNVYYKILPYIKMRRAQSIQIDGEEYIYLSYAKNFEKIVKKIEKSVKKGMERVPSDHNHK